MCKPSMFDNKLPTNLSILSPDGFSLSAYIIEKALDFGTGRLWRELGKYIKSDRKYSLELYLYNAIEQSLRELVPIYYKLEQIEPACEILFTSWVKNSYFKPQDITAALNCMSATKGISCSQWLDRFEKTVAADSELYAQFIMRNGYYCLETMGRMLDHIRTVQSGLNVASQKEDMVHTKELLPAATVPEPPTAASMPSATAPEPSATVPVPPAAASEPPAAPPSPMPPAGMPEHFQSPQASASAWSAAAFLERTDHGDLKDYICNFIGRAHELGQLGKCLGSGHVTVITAGPGYGKTSLALKYARDMHGDYERILFINCETAVDIYRSLQILYEKEDDLDMGIRGNILRRIKSIVAGAGSGLIIFDNYGYDHIAEYQKLGALENALRAVIDELHEDHEGLDIIVTTRLAGTLFADQTLYLLEEMTPEDAGAYLNSGGQCLFSEAEIVDIQNHWGRLPIVLNMVRTVTALAGSYDQVASIYMNASGETQGNLYLLFRRLFGELAQSAEGAIFLTILKAASLLDSDGIQKELLFEALKGSDAEADLLRFDMIMANYVQHLNILKRSGDTFYMHRTYQESIRLFISAAEQRQLERRIMETLRGKLHWFSYYGYSEWEQMRDYLAHIDRLFLCMPMAERAEYNDVFLQSAWYTGYVLNDFALYDKYMMSIMGSRVSGQDAYIKGLAICDAVLIWISSGKPLDYRRAQHGIRIIESLLACLKADEDKYIMLRARYCLCISEYEIMCGHGDAAFSMTREGEGICKNCCSRLENVILFDSDRAFEYTFMLEHWMMLLNQSGKLLRLYRASPDAAIQKHTKVLSLIKERAVIGANDNNYKVIEAFSANAVAVCYYEQNGSNDDLRQALSYYQMACDIYEKLGFNYGMVNELLNCAAIYRQLALNVLTGREPAVGTVDWADKFRRAQRESFVAIRLGKSENEAFEMSLRAGLSSVAATFRGYVYNAWYCLEAIGDMIRQGLSISDKLLKDFYIYHYELEIAKTRDPYLESGQIEEILEAANGYLELAMDIVRRHDYKLDLCRQLRYQGVLFRKMAEITEGAVRAENYHKAVEKFKAAIALGVENDYMTGTVFAKCELALAYAMSGDKDRATAVLDKLAPDMRRCDHAGVKQRCEAVRKMITSIFQGNP